MPSKPRNQDARPQFRTLEDVIKHFQPSRAKGDEREQNPFAELHQTLSPEAFRKVRAELVESARTT